MATSPAPSTIRAVLDRAEARLRAADIDPARREAEWLLEHVSGLGRLDLIMRPDDDLSPDLVRHFEALMERRLAREPLQYLTGEAGFYGHMFRVSPHVLIPRPETEMLVEWIAGQEDLSAGVLDLGTGSGCIPISVRLARPDASCTGVDISRGALDTARENARRLDADVRFVEADMLTDSLPAVVGGPFSVVVSNPPYIGEEEAEGMQPEVVGYEPHTALFAPGDALAFYRHLARAAVDLLVDGGRICLEVHADRGADVAGLLREAGWQDVQVHRDLSGRDRMVVARHPN